MFIIKDTGGELNIGGLLDIGDGRSLVDVSAISCEAAAYPFMPNTDIVVSESDESDYAAKIEVNHYSESEYFALKNEIAPTVWNDPEDDTYFNVLDGNIFEVGDRAQCWSGGNYETIEVVAIDGNQLEVTRNVSGVPIALEEGMGINLFNRTLTNAVAPIATGCYSILVKDSSNIIPRNIEVMVVSEAAYRKFFAGGGVNRFGLE